MKGPVAGMAVCAPRTEGVSVDCEFCARGCASFLACWRLKSYVFPSVIVGTGESLSVSVIAVLSWSDSPRIRIFSVIRSELVHTCLGLLCVRNSVAKAMYRKALTVLKAFVLLPESHTQVHYLLVDYYHPQQFICRFEIRCLCRNFREQF